MREFFFKSMVGTALPALAISLLGMGVSFAEETVEIQPIPGNSFSDHQQTVAQGGVGNYTTSSDSSSEVESSNDISETTELPSRETGRFLDHDQIVSMGGVGNYVSSSEAKHYDQRLAEREQVKSQVAAENGSGLPEQQAVAEANPDQGIVFFQTGGSELSADARREIGNMAQELKQNPDLMVEVNSYADSVGESGSNQKLSEERSKSVKDELLSQGVKLKQIQTYAFGAQDPIASNDTSSGRSVNRRAELYIENESEMTG